MKKIILVTGATSGIGEAIALKFAENGYGVIITGRRKERLEKLKLRIENEIGGEALPLHFDVRILRDVENAIRSLPEDWKEIDILINNAGLAAGLSPVHEYDIEDWERMIDTNIKGLLYMTRCIAPMMVARKKGHIINIGSVAGKEVYPSGNVYCGSKFAVDAISRGTRIDLVQHGIKVTHIAPGAANTEFALVRFHGDRDKAEKIYEGFKPLSAKDVADIVYYTTTLPDHVNINDIVITCTAQASSMHFHKVI